MSAAPLARLLTRTFPMRWWARQSLPARLTIVATALFTIAVATGSILLVTIQRYSLLRVLDQSAAAAATDVAAQITRNPNRPVVDLPVGGVAAVQVVNAQDAVIAKSPSADPVTPLLDAAQLRQARTGVRFNIDRAHPDTPLRVVGLAVGSRTVLVATDLTRIDDSVRILGQASLIGGPLAVLLLAAATYTVAALTLRPVEELRHGAADIAATGLADQRLPVPSSQDEIHRLAVTLNAMLDRIDSATQRQRTFVGDAAHELRSPLASLRVQLEVAQRLGPITNAMIEDVLVDVGRVERLVKDLLALARFDEGRAVLSSEPVVLAELLREVVEGYRYARVPVTLDAAVPGTVSGDPEGLRRVAVNLIDNGVRYARTGVHVAVGEGQRGGQPTVTITVIDDGYGVPPEERERVFDRFYRVHASRSRESGGTGLGLPIVRDLVRAHGGSVRLTTPPSGTGLAAVVVLPTAR